MNIKQLEEKLKKENISEYYYSLEGGLPNEAFCINRNNDLWEAYYSERGNKSQVKTFEFEEDACDYFYNWLMKILKRYN